MDFALVKPSFPLQKHVYSNVLKILPPKNENFHIKNSDIFHVSAQNIVCEYSLKPLRRGILNRNKKNNVYPGKPQFYYIKMGLNWVKII